MLRKDWDELEKGDWCFINDDTYIAIQLGDEKFTESCILPITQDENNHPNGEWIWNGSKELPSLFPSILHWGKGRNQPATWHGYLTDGKLIEC